MGSRGRARGRISTGSMPLRARLLFSSRRRHGGYIGDWSSDVCSSDLIMADFCRRALAYIAREPLDRFKKLKTPELGERLLHHLQNRPWLLVLDGLERVLVAYHRFDAAQVADEEASQL